MRVLPFGPDAPSGLRELVTIQMGLITKRFTNADRNITVDTETWQTLPGCDVTGFQMASDGTAGNLDVVLNAVEGGLFEPGDGLRGIVDEWPITVALVNPADPSSTFTLLSGTLVGSVEEDALGRVILAANGPLRQIQQWPLCEHFSLICRADLGDDWCKIPILLHKDRAHYDIQRSTDYIRLDTNAGILTEAGVTAVTQVFGRVRVSSGGTIDDYGNVYFECTTSGTTGASEPSWPTTPGSTVVDGTVTWTCRNAWFRSARAEALDSYTIQLSSFNDDRADDNLWFVDGGIFFRTGALADYPKATIKAWDPDTQRLTLFLPLLPDDVPAGTECEVHPGCNLTRVDCFEKFNNIVNGRFETFVPPPDAIFSI